MLYNSHSIPLDITLHDFLTKVLWTEEHLSPIQHSLSIEILEKFQAAGCSYYDLLSVVASVD